MRHNTWAHINRMLMLLNEYPEGLPAREVGELFWPDSPEHRKVYNIGNGAHRGVGMWLAAGSYLHRLEKKGLVERYWQYRDQIRWIVSEKGKERIR